MPATPDSYNALLLHLYRQSYEQPIDHFQDAALELLKPVLPFDSAWWGSATMTAAGLDVHTIHLHNQPAELLQAYEEVKHLDTAAQMVTMRPADTLAFDGHALFGGRHQKAARDYVRRFEQSHFFVGSILIPNRRFTRWLTLFRADERAYCTETERALLAGLMPHVMQAQAFNCVTHLNHMNMGSTLQRGTAIADLRGVLYHADPVFDELMGVEWEGGSKYKLPAPVLEHFLQGQSHFLGRAVVMSHHTEHNLLFLKIRSSCRADRLTPREHTVAKLVAKGDTYKEIARLLNRAPATVRNHIQAIYEKLNVNHVAGLIEELRLAD